MSGIKKKKKKKEGKEQAQHLVYMPFTLKKSFE